MTNAQIARMLREAAMYAHYSDETFGPRIATLFSICRDDIERWSELRDAIDQYFDLHQGEWTREITVLALLFAAEAVEGEG